MTTTMVRNSIVGDAWIQQTMAAVPVQRIIDPKTNNFNGDILTGPVRLAFENLWELPKPRQGQTSEPKFGAQLLFPPGVDFNIIYEEYYKACGQNFAEYYVPPSPGFGGGYQGLHSPFRDQVEKIKFSGYTPGCVFMTCTSKFKPPVVDNRMNPIVDRNRIYSGVWAICAIKPYDYGKNPPQPKKGIAFGLQSVMIIGDDEKFAGQGPDAREQFAGVNVTAPVARPNFANMPTNAPPPAAGIPGYTAPGGGVSTPYPPAGTPHVPQTHYQPPAQPAYPPQETEDQRLMREMGIG